jgi:hypothetical protein
MFNHGRHQFDAVAFQGPRIVFAKQSSRNLAGSSSRRFGGREISLGVQNAADIVTDDAARQAVLTMGLL